MQAFWRKQTTYRPSQPSRFPKRSAAWKSVTSAVAEGSNEVGTVYYSDTYGLEDRLKVLQVVPYDLTGNVIYPAAQVVNKEADETEQAAAKDFVEFLTSDEAAAIFRNYYFDTEVE